MSQDITGRCLCGAVTFAATVEKPEVGACHCGMCRRWSGGPLLVIDAGDDVRFAGEDNVSVYKSSQWGERGFCKTCGSNLFWRAQTGGHYAISAGTLDKGEGLVFTKEIYIDDKPAYYDFANDTEKKTGAEFMAAFADGKE